MNEYFDALARFKPKLPALLKDRHPDKSPEELDLLFAMVVAQHHALCMALIEGGMQRIAAIRYIARLTKLQGQETDTQQECG